MSCKDILVFLDDSKGGGRSVDAAIHLAQAHDSHLTGLSAAVEQRAPAYMEVHIPAEVFAEQAAEAMVRARSLAESFIAKVEQAGLSVDVRTERCLEPELPRLIATHARYADLTVLDQPNPEQQQLGGVDLPETVALSSGRPTFIVPYIGLPKTVAKRVMVAWDAKRESARALHDALPILEKADSVIVLVVDPKTGVNGHGERPGADIALHLARHGCKVEAQHTVSGDVSIGDIILSRLADQGVDLLVMGAYGHARMRELILGGVTRHIMRHMTVPVLVSH